MGKDKKKSKKHRKEKDKKKHYSSSSESSSSDEWVEKEESSGHGKERERDEWMSMETIFSGKSRDELIERKKRDVDKDKQPSLLVEPGQSSRELNPFWKDGGTGLPPEEEATRSSLSSGVGDLGVDWLRRALKRAKEQAEDEGRSLDSVISERWGSMSKFEKLLNEAESKSRKHTLNDRERDDYRRSPRRDDYSREKRDDRYQQSRNERFRDSRDDRPRNMRDDAHRSDDRRSSRDVGYSSHQSDDRRNFRSVGESSHRSDDRRSSRNVDDSRHRDSRDQSSQFKKLNFKRPDSDSDSERKSKSYHSSSSKKNWKKPGYEDKKEVNGSTSERVVENPKECSPEVMEVCELDDETSVKSNDEEEDDGDEMFPSQDELNELYANYMRAHLDGQAELAKKRLAIYWKGEEKLKNAEKGLSTGLVDEKGRNVRLLTETDKRGFTRPVQGRVGEGSTKRRRAETHQGNERVRYFPDDDNHSLQDMFEKEKYDNQAENDAEFYKLMKKVSHEDDDAFDSARMDTKAKDDRRNRQEAIRKMAAKEKVLDNCRWCIGGEKASSNNIVLCKNTIYVAVPSFQSLTEGHCLIVPQAHVSSATMLDEDVWAEIMDVRKELVETFRKDNEDVIFFESALYIDRHPHMLLHCVPVPIEIGDTAPIYFKKALLECETEWTNNKKVVELRGRDVRRAVPKGLPYFAVDFGMQSGYAHVIEDKKLFPHNFAQEIIGGMLDLDHSLWRKPKRDSDEEIEKKVDSLRQLLQA